MPVKPFAEPIRAISEQLHSSDGPPAHWKYHLDTIEHVWPHLETVEEILLVGFEYGLKESLHVSLQLPGRLSHVMVEYLPRLRPSTTKLSQNTLLIARCEHPITGEQLVSRKSLSQQAVPRILFTGVPQQPMKQYKEEWLFQVDPQTGISPSLSGSDFEDQDLVNELETELTRPHIWPFFRDTNSVRFFDRLNFFSPIYDGFSLADLLVKKLELQFGPDVDSLHPCRWSRTGTKVYSDQQAIGHIMAHISIARRPDFIKIFNECVDELHRLQFGESRSPDEG